MKKNSQAPLWIYFAKKIFAMMLGGSCCLFLTGIVFYQINFIGMRFGSPIRLGLYFGLFSIFLGTGVALVVGRKILYPITRLSEKMKEVAEGDFTIQLEDDSHIHEMEELYKDFNAMVRELSTIETLRNDFVSSVSHEFKTPIATLQGYVQLLQNSELSEEDRQEYLARIMDGTRQLSQLTENILKLTKIETQGMTLEEKEFRLDEQIRSVILFLEPEWDRQGIEWDIELDRCCFCGNEELLYQVWLNIIGNAIKYSNAGGTIWVSLRNTEESVAVEIRDSGIGMAQETLTHIFDKFFQADTARKTKGNGLGLTLAKRIVDSYGGEIKVESALGEGTAMIVRFERGSSKI